MTTRSVLFDASILSTRTRDTGIGRYVVELGRQLGKSVPGDLRVRYLIGAGLRHDIVDDADEAIARSLAMAEVSRPAWSYGLRAAGAATAKRAGAQLIHLPHAGATPLGLGLLGVRSIVTCHDLIPLRHAAHYGSWRDGWGRGLRLLMRRRFVGADHVIAISDATAHELATLLGVMPSDVSVVLHGIDHGVWKPAPDGDAQRLAALDLPPSFLLYVGAADWRKNHRAMFRALNLANQRGADVSLVWAGRLRDDHARLVERDRQALRPRVRMLGHVDDATLRALYRSALGTLYVSRAEGFGYPLLEAMCVGSPVIAGNTSSLPEVVGDAALSVDPESDGAIADAIVALARDAALRRALRDRGFARAAKFTLERQATETLAAYRRALSLVG